MEGYLELCNRLDKDKMILLDEVYYKCDLIKSPFCCVYMHVSVDDILVFNPLTLKLLMPSTNNTNGYIRYNIPRSCGFTERNTIYLHQLVGIWKYGDFFMYNHEFQIDHIDNNKANNWPDNIQILSRRENAAKQIFSKPEVIYSNEEMKAFFPDVFNEIYMSNEHKLYKPINKKEGIWKLLKPHNKKHDIYVLTDKNKRRRNVSLNQYI